jgi:hypothetical protein
MGAGPFSMTMREAEEEGTGEDTLPPTRGPANDAADVADEEDTGDATETAPGEARPKPPGADSRRILAAPAAALAAAAAPGLRGITAAADSRRPAAPGTMGRAGLLIPRASNRLLRRRPAAISEARRFLNTLWRRSSLSLRVKETKLLAASKSAGKPSLTGHMSRVEISVMVTVAPMLPGSNPRKAALKAIAVSMAAIRMATRCGRLFTSCSSSGGAKTEPQLWLRRIPSIKCAHTYRTSSSMVPRRAFAASSVSASSSWSSSTATRCAAAEVAVAAEPAGA